jgi:hypothetical protein
MARTRRRAGRGAQGDHGEGAVRARFDKEHIAIRVKASTGKEYRRNLQRFILPALGQLRDGRSR